MQLECCKGLDERFMREVKVKPEMYVSTFKLELVKTVDNKTQRDRLRNWTEDYTISGVFTLISNSLLQIIAYTTRAFTAQVFVPQHLK